MSKLVENVVVENAYWAAVGTDFKMFLRHSFGTLCPGQVFLDNWHVDAIVHRLQQSAAGKMPRLTINLPPRHLKSVIVSVAFPAFLLGRDPTAKIICVSYSDELAKALAGQFRRLVSAPWYQKVFPNVQAMKSTETEFATAEGGFRFATSVTGTLTGRGGDFLIIDDPLKPKDANSDRLRLNVNEWYRNTLMSRLDDKEYGVIINVQQRVHAGDLSGVLEASGFYKLSFPAIATQDEVIDISDTEQYHRSVGEPLHAERESLETLANIKKQMQTAVFSAQYQQQPETPEGSMFKRHHFKFIDSWRDVKPGGQYWVSIDTALSMSESADYSCLTVGYTNDDAHHILFADRGHWDFDMLRAKALKYVKLNKNFIFVVEYAGSGISLYQFLVRQDIPCHYYQPKRSKTERALAVIPILDEGLVCIMNIDGSNGWVKPFIDEFMVFPNGGNDDQVDSLVQVISWRRWRINSRAKVHLWD